MAWQGWLTYSIVFLWLIPGAIWRRSSLALLSVWAIAEVNYLLNGVYIPREMYLVGDLIVIAAILTFSRHWTDWCIAALFPAAWLLYFTEPSQAQWESLYWIAIAQFLLAGPWTQFERQKDNEIKREVYQ